MHYLVSKRGSCMRIILILLVVRDSCQLFTSYSIFSSIILSHISAPSSLVTPESQVISISAMTMISNLPLHWPSVWSSLFCSASLFSSLVLLFIAFRKLFNSKPNVESHIEEKPHEDGYPPVEPLPEFDWKTKDPIKIRPFKAKYNLTMSKTLEGFIKLLPLISFQAFKRQRSMNLLKWTKTTWIASCFERDS